MSDRGPRTEKQQAADASAPQAAQALLATLAELATSLQQHHTTAEILEVAGRGLTGLDLHLALLRVDGPLLVLEFLARRDAIVETVEQVMRQSIEGTACPLEVAPLAFQALKERRFIYSDDMVQLAIQFLAHFPGADWLCSALADSAYRRAVLCPVFLRGEPWGVVMLAGTWLSLERAPALGLFGMQLASSLTVAESNAALEDRERDLAAIHSVATTGSEEELERLLPKLLRIAAQSTGSDHAAIYLLQPERELVLAGTHGYRAPMEERHTRLAAGTALEDVALSLKPRALNVRQWPVRVRPDLRAEGIEETALLPLHVQLRPSGCLLLSRSTPRPYTDEDLAFGKLLAEQLAIHLENARLYAKAQRKVEQLSLLFAMARLGTEAREVTPFIQGVLAQTVDAFGVDGALLYLMHEGRLVLAGHQLETPWGPEVDLTPIREIPLDDQTQVARAAQGKRAASSTRDGLSEMAARFGVRYSASAPLIAKDQVVGAFMVVRRSSRPFADDELLLFESCAASVGVAIEQVRLFEAERQRVRDLSVINELGGHIAQRLELSSVLRSGIVHLGRLTGVPNVFLLLLDATGQFLRAAASSLDEPGVLEISIPLTEASAATAAVHARRPVVLDDAANDERATKVLARRFGHRALLAVPLLSDGRALGAIVLGETRPGLTFVQEAVDRAVAIANQLATAIAGARLYDDLKRSYHDLARAQEELVRRERLAAVGELAALVAHEVRNPLATIFNSLSSLRRMLKPDNGSVDLLLGIMNEEADRLNRMVGDFLDFARPNEPLMQPEVLEQLMTDAVESATSTAMEGHRVEVKLELPGPLGPVPCDARLVRQALINLVVNAIQSMPKGGKVEVRATEERWQGQPFIRMDVSDNGPGIPPHVAERLFEPFFTTKASGTGLGLAVVKRIIEAHHGDIEVRTQAGQGTTFTLRIPATLDAAGPSPDLAAP